MHHRGPCFVLYKSIIFSDQFREAGGPIIHTSQLISLIVGHLDINVPRSGRRSSDWRRFDLFRDHGLQVNIDVFVFENPETALGGDSRLVCTCWTKDAYRGVLDREFLVLLKGLSEGM